MTSRHVPPAGNPARAKVPDRTQAIKSGTLVPASHATRATRRQQHKLRLGYTRPMVRHPSSPVNNQMGVPR